MCICVCAESGPGGGGLCRPCGAGGSSAAAEGGSHGAEQDGCRGYTTGPWDIFILCHSNISILSLTVNAASLFRTSVHAGWLYKRYICTAGHEVS